MLRRAVSHRGSFPPAAGAARNSRSAPRFSPEAPLGDLPKIVENMSVTDVDSVLRLIAQQARLVTAATGSAIALGAGEEFFCRAVAGEKAPPLGARIRSDSGLTGECIRRHVTLRCDDAEKDDRVDADACREFQVRSIAVIPVRLGSELAGVLEVFSNHASAFTNSHLATLERIADLIAASCQRVATLIIAAASDPSGAGEAAVVVSPPPAAPAPVAPSEDARLSRLQARAKLLAAACVSHAAGAVAKVQPQLIALQRLPKSWRLGGAALLVVIVTALGFVVGQRRVRSPQAPAATAPVASQAESAVSQVPSPVTIENSSPAPASSPAATPETVPPPKPMAGRPVATPSAPAAAPATSEDVVVLKVPPPTARAKPSPAADAESSQPPEFEKVTALASAPVTGLLNAPVAAPKLTATERRPVSQGVVPGRLLRKVNPAYPVQAREARLQGAVVLDVLINKNGKVGQVRVLSGHPLLNQAAVQAVKAWVYEPFRLNGEPIDAETQVTVKFSQ